MQVSGARDAGEIKFTIVVPTYNRGDLIDKAIDSILGQSYQNFEIIIVDNCSTDHTADVVARYTDPRIIYLVNDRNYERSYSRNRGFSHATGDYVTLLDSDDILYPTCLQDAAGHIREKGSSFFHFLFDNVDGDYKPISRSNSRPITNPFRELMKGNYISNNAVFYKKEIVDKIRFDETPVMIGVEDYDFVIRVLAETGSVLRIEKVNGGVLFHPNRSVNLEQWDRTLERIRYFIAKQVASEKFREVFGKYTDVFKAHLNLYLSSFAAVRGRSLRAFRFLLRSVAERPSIVLTIKFWKHFLLIFKYIF